MSSCLERETLILYCLGLLDEREKIKIEEHINKCIACKREIKIEKEIEEDLSIELDPGPIEQKIIKKIRIYNCLPKYDFSLRYLSIFLFCATFLCIILSIYYFIDSLPDIFSFLKNEQLKGLIIEIQLFFKDLSWLMKSEEFQIFILLVSVLFFILNFLYAFKKYFFKNKYI